LPAKVTAACGHPGKRVNISRVPLTVRRADCDLTGVIVVYRHAGAAVPARPGGVSGSADGVDAAHSGTISVTVTKRFVTIDGGI
jgi:hypothetical protein